MIMIFITYALFGSAIVSNKILLNFLTPSLLVGLRMSIAGTLLQLYNFIIAKYKFNLRLIKNHFLMFLFVTLATTVVPSILKAYGLKNMISSKAAFFGSLDPFITALYAAFIFGENINFQKLIGISLGFLGTSILLFAGHPLDEPLKAFAEFSWPELALLGSVFISRLGWMIVQSFLKKNIYKPSQVNAFTMFIGGFITLIWAGFTEQINVTKLPVSLPLLSYWPLSGFTKFDIISIFLAYTIIFGNLIGYTLYTYLLKSYSATVLSLSGFSVPLFVALFGWLVLNEPLTAPFFTACAVTFIGMLIFFDAERKSAT